jgi:hypothetical protein
VQGALLVSGPEGAVSWALSDCLNVDVDVDIPMSVSGRDGEKEVDYGWPVSSLPSPGRQPLCVTDRWNVDRPAVFSGVIEPIPLLKILQCPRPELEWWVGGWDCCWIAAAS